MLIIPAIDLHQGKVVNLRQGKVNEETAYSDNPIEIARKGRTLLKSKVCQEDALGFGLEMLETYSQRASEVTNALIERWKF